MNQFFIPCNIRNTMLRVASVICWINHFYKERVVWNIVTVELLRTLILDGVIIYVSMEIYFNYLRNEVT